MVTIYAIMILVPYVLSVARSNKSHIRTFTLFTSAGALGWNEEASEAAIRQCNGNVTSAVQMLENEELAMLEQFESAVKDMVRGGGD